MKRLSIAPIVGLVVMLAARAAGDVKISQVWGGGGVSSGTPNADYVELFNTDPANPVDLAGWALQIATATGASWSKVDLSGTIAPRGYFLVRLAAPATTGTSYTPDLSATLSGATLASTAGKVALTSTTALLAGACPWPAATIVDFVGYGTTANCREGAAVADNAPGGSTTGAGQTAHRRCAGLTDADANAADFELRPPVPRNSSSPANPGTGVTLSSQATPPAIPPGGIATLTVNVRVCSGVSTNGVVTVDASLVDGGIIDLTDDGTGVFSGELIAGPELTPGPRDLPYSFSDDEGRSGEGVVRVLIAPFNDACSAAPVLDVPSVTVGTTIGSTPDNGAYNGPTCGTTIGTGGGVWYALIGTGHTIVVDTCDNSGLVAPYDTKLHVFCGSCGGLTCVGGNDDGPAGCGLIGGAARGSRVSFCSQPGATYLVLVNGFGAAVGDFRLAVSDSGTPCTGAVACVPTGRCCVGQGCTVTTESACTQSEGLYGGDGTDCSGALHSFAYAGPAVSIPDNNPTGASVSIVVSDPAVIDQLRVVVDIVHTWVGDLRATITNGNQTVTLFYDTGDPTGATTGDSSNLDGAYRFYDAAPLDWWAAAAAGDSSYVIPPGDYRPADALTGNLPTPSLAAFDGQPFAGTWTLTVRDVQAADVGQIRRWRIESTATRPPCNGSGCPNTGCDLGDIDGNCVVNLSDLTLLLSNFGSVGPGLPGDVEPDGDVDLSDLTAMLSQFGNDCN